MDIQTQSQLPVLRQLLNYRRRELLADVRASRLASELQEISTIGVTDRPDIASRVQAQRLDERQEARDLAELEDVEAALHRLDAGLYGACADCEEAIPLARLLSQPAARRCAPCQGAWERRSRQH